MDNVNGYDLSRSWFNWSFENPDKVKPIHSAIYFFAIEHCNRLGWKQKFGFPSQMVMESIGVKNWRTYSKALNDLVDFGFIKMIEISKNQYSSNIIAIVKNTKAPTKALDKALSKHSTKHSQSTVSIDKQLNKEQINKELLSEFSNSLKPFLGEYSKEMLNEFYLYWTEKGERAIKYRWQKEKTWELSRRLKRWSNNNFNSKNVKKEITSEAIKKHQKIIL